MTMEELVPRVRTAAFREMLATGGPASVTGLAAATRAGEDEIRAAVDYLLAAGRARIDENGNVTAAAGLRVTPTRHRIQTGHGSRWTNCAYDALGILGALATVPDDVAGGKRAWSGEVAAARPRPPLGRRPLTAAPTPRGRTLPLAAIAGSPRR